ncbi:hypothetical protein GCM10010313_83570 [Streptomyces violarus]|nr:hypothetical protein GCM10010313_83570 [Streptomyces violarus]
MTQLVVSELVTNARQYAPGPVPLELRITAHALPWMLSRGTSGPHRARCPGRRSRQDRPARPGIVKAVTKDLFTEQEPVGKRITARIARRPQRARHQSPPPNGSQRAPLSA